MRRFGCPFGWQDLPLDIPVFDECDSAAAIVVLAQIERDAGLVTVPDGHPDEIGNILTQIGEMKEWSQRTITQNHQPIETADANIEKMQNNTPRFGRS